MLGCSTGGGVEDEVPEGEAVALLCLRDEDRLWRGPSGNHGAYESLVTVTLVFVPGRSLKLYGVVGQQRNNGQTVPPIECIR